MDSWYSLYGLTFRSDLPLPGLLPVDPQTSCDVHLTLRGPKPEIDLSHTPWFVSTSLEENSQPILTVWKITAPAGFYFRYGDGTEFLVDHQGTQIAARWPESLNLENTTTYIVGQIAAFVLRLRGFVCLHGSSILVNDRVLTIVGETGAGKSTTAACFTRLGYSVLSEDVTALMNAGTSFYVQPGYPRINLWDDAATSLHGDPAALPKIAPTWTKRYLDLEKGSRFHKQPAPLSGVYILHHRAKNNGDVWIEGMSRQEALLSLLTHAHGRYLLEKTMRVREFEWLSQLASLIPVRSVAAHTGLERIDQLCKVILTDFEQSGSSLSQSV